MTALTGEWRSYFSEQCADDIERLGDAYPDQRSLYVDLLDVHEFDSEFLGALFEAPDRVLSAGRSVLRDAIGVSGPVHLRVENNPQQRSVSGIRSHHVHDLVTVTGVVESVGPRRASALTAAYDCPVCESSITLSQTGIDMADPTRCDNCGWDGQFTFRPSESQFVDRQEVTLAAPSEDGETADTQRLPTYLDDDIVGAAGEDDRYNVTGILRVHRAGPTNEFTLYLDVLSVHDERQVTEPDTPDDVLDSHWGLGEE